MAVGLGIDAGGSSSRWLLLSEMGQVLGEGQGDPLTGHLFGAAAQAEQIARLESIVRAATAVQTPDALVAGITGFHRDTLGATRLGESVSALLGLEPHRVLLANDMHVAFAAAFNPGEGVLVYAGTGSVAYHVTCTGEVLRAGGYGYLIDDAGSGYWIGRRGLKALLRRLDAAGAPPDTPLAERLYAKLGSRSWSEIMPVVYGGGRSFVASLAPAVAAAEAAGDVVARAILQQAGAELARLARDVRGRLPEPLPAAFAGGIARLSPVLRESLEHHLGAPVTPVDEAPVRAAARLALQLARRS